MDLTNDYYFQIIAMNDYLFPIRNDFGTISIKYVFDVQQSLETRKKTCTLIEDSNYQTLIYADLNFFVKLCSINFSKYFT